jgi:hypothetical protein
MVLGTASHPAPEDYSMLCRRVRRRLATAVAMVASAVSLSLPAWAAAQLPPSPPTPPEPAAIEAFGPYQPQFFCRSAVEPGVKAFERLVLRAYPTTHSLGDMRGCAVAGTSEHKDGRAWDWAADHRVAKQRAAGRSLLRWLFASDGHGNRDAMFRRLGLMYVIWNKRIWGAWDQRWEPYSCSGVTACHVDHMHFSFGWAGAERRTSYWTGRVARAVEPPLRHFARRHAARRLTLRAGDEITAHWLLIPGATYRVIASGTLRRAGAATSDAECVKTRAGWQPSQTLSIGGDQLHLWGRPWQPTVDTGNGCNTATHTYRMTLRPALLTTMTAELSRPAHRTGEIRLRIVRSG